MNKLELNKAFQAADDAWSAELAFQFGKKAGDMILMHRTTSKEEHLLASLKAAIAAFDISLVKEIEAIVAEELDHRANEMREIGS